MLLKEPLMKKTSWVSILWFSLLHAAGIAAIAYWINFGFSFGNWMLFSALFLYSAFGITAGYHREVTHNSFAAIVIKVILLIGAASAFMGAVLGWTTNHRLHHKYSDQPGDPHSPREGFFWAHIGWLLRPYQYPKGEIEKIVRDLENDRIIFWERRLYLLSPVLICIVLPLALFGWEGLLLSGVLRMLSVYHVTWSINSLCHMPPGFFIKKLIDHARHVRLLNILLYIVMSPLWLALEFILIFGRKPKNTNDNSRNNWLLGLPTLGESMHNDHHFDPKCAYHGSKLYHIDPTKWLIMAIQLTQISLRLVKIRLIWDIKMPRKSFSH